MHKTHGRYATIAVVLALVVASAPAQRRAAVNRPSSSAASQHLGEIGGTNTELGRVSSLRGTRGEARGIPGAAPRLGTGHAALRALPLDTGLNVRMFTNRRIPDRGIYNVRPEYSQRLRALSGFTEATSHRRVPDYLIGASWPPRVLVPRPDYTPKPETGFQRFFNLRPAAEDTSSADAKVKDDRPMSARLEAEVDKRLSAMKSRALAHFKAATTATDDEARSTEMGRAMSLLSSLRRLQRDAYLPSLLTVHGALGQEHLGVAITNLYLVTERKPDLFSDFPEMAQYFGDFDEAAGESKWLERQMRQFVQAGDSNPESAASQMIAGYCAWVLNDKRRAAEAMARFERLDAIAAADERIVAFFESMRQALEASAG